MPVTADATAFWQGRRSDDDFLRAWACTEQLHRRVLVEQLHLFPPFRSLRELGCGPGTNLRLIQRAFPWVELSGVDVDPAAAQFASVRLANGSRAHITTANVLDDAATWAPRSVDVLCSCYCLAYIAPTDLTPVMAAIVRAARVGVLLMEPQAGGVWANVPGLIDGLSFPEWRHDYVRGLAGALQAAGRNAKVWGAKLAVPADRCDGAVAGVFIP